jgi:hypothetical protein
VWPEILVWLQESPDATAKTLFKANSSQLPKDNTRAPKIVVVKPSGLSSSVVTTDFFGFDTSDNHFHLQGLGNVSEMGDAILGHVISEHLFHHFPGYEEGDLSTMKSISE